MELKSKLLDLQKNMVLLLKYTLLINNIELAGEARQMKVCFFSNGKKTDKYYFQTHIRVKSINQIKVLS
jgi:hypothetical protein